MHWERSNVNPMLALRTGVCNDRWEETMQQASRHRLLTRRSRRFARQTKTYEEMTQKVKKLFLRLFFLMAHPQLKTQHLPASAAQRELGVLPSHQTTSEINKLMLDNRRLQIRWEAHSLSWNASVWHYRPHQ